MLTWLFSHTTCGLSPRGSQSSNAGRICLFLTVLLLLASSANAQLQQPFVYTTGGAIATRDDATGALAPTIASPIAVLGFPTVLDAKGRFLFAAGNNSIHMYQVDAVTGSYTEVWNSPFHTTNTNNPILIATEPTGTYLAVVNSIGLNPGESSVESFQINAAAGALNPRFLSRVGFHAHWRGRRSGYGQVLRLSGTKSLITQSLLPTGWRPAHLHDRSADRASR